MTSPTHFVNIQIGPDQGLLEKIQVHQQKLQTRLPSVDAKPGEVVTLVEEGNLHLTVCGLGLEDDEEETQVIQFLQDPVTLREAQGLGEGGSSVSVRLRGLEVFLPVNEPSGTRGPCAVVIRMDREKSGKLMRLIEYLRGQLAGFIRERLRDSGLPYCPHVTIATNCYHDDPASVLGPEDRGADFGVSVVSKIYLSKMGDTTDAGVYKHRATLCL